MEIPITARELVMFLSQLPDDARLEIIDDERGTRRLMRRSDFTFDRSTHRLRLHTVQTEA